MYSIFKPALRPFFVLTVLLFLLPSCPEEEDATSLPAPSSFSSIDLTGSKLDFSNDGTFVDLRDGQEYGWVDIAGQAWMTDNLNYSGLGLDPIGVSSRDVIFEDVEGYTIRKPFRYYTAEELLAEDFSTNNSLSQTGICPPGWHVPSNIEYRDLLATVSVDLLIDRQAGWTSFSGEPIIVPSLPTGVLPTGFKVQPDGECWIREDGNYVSGAKRMALLATAVTSQSSGELMKRVVRMAYGSNGRRSFSWASRTVSDEGGRHGVICRCVRD